MYIIKHKTMDSKTAQELLLKKEVISKRQATQILSLWGKNPQAYHTFLRNKEVSQPVRVYKGLSPDQSEHQFVPVQSQVPNEVIAEKFFKLDDDDIIEKFISVIVKLSVSKLSRFNICAWPYLNYQCLKHTSIEVLISLMCSGNFVFDFSHDFRGELFDSLYRRQNSDLYRDILAANSFNILNWQRQANKYPLREATIRILMAEHFIESDPKYEPLNRKFYIHYRLDVESTADMFYQSLIQSKSN
ncbi:MAG: hypothetical protein J6W96_02215 [Alphaproteobacteria bacterium]|nr:hypothetical protein [Alphaproteobacteria bacterium]